MFSYSKIILFHYIWFILDESYIIRTQHSNDFGDFTMVTGINQFWEFSVEACHTVFVGLYTNSVDMTRYQYSISIGIRHVIVIRIRNVISNTCNIR